jgi:hypothetical protein
MESQRSVFNRGTASSPIGSFFLKAPFCPQKGVFKGQKQPDCGLFINYYSYLLRSDPECKEKTRIALQLEQPQKHSKLFPRAIKPVDVELKLKKMVKPIDAHPIVTEGEKPRPGIEWQVTSIVKVKRKYRKTVRQDLQDQQD